MIDSLEGGVGGTLTLGFDRVRDDAGGRDHFGDHRRRHHRIGPAEDHVHMRFEPQGHVRSRFELRLEGSALESGTKISRMVMTLLRIEDESRWSAV
jgi:hypothetical protein